MARCKEKGAKRAIRLAGERARSTRRSWARRRRAWSRRSTTVTIARRARARDRERRRAAGRRRADDIRATLGRAAPRRGALGGIDAHAASPRARGLRRARHRQGAARAAQVDRAGAKSANVDDPASLEETLAAFGGRGAGGARVSGSARSRARSRSSPAARPASAARSSTRSPQPARRSRSSAATSSARRPRRPRSTQGAGARLRGRRGRRRRGQRRVRGDRRRRTGALDVLVNNSGVTRDGLVLRMSRRAVGRGGRHQPQGRVPLLPRGRAHDAQAEERAHRERVVGRRRDGQSPARPTTSPRRRA